MKHARLSFFAATILAAIALLAGCMSARTRGDDPPPLRCAKSRTGR